MVANVPRQGSDPGPPRWLISATAVLALWILLMSVAETTLWTHFLIGEAGEYLSLAALAASLVAGLYLHKKKRLAGSLLLFVPWLIYPWLTQADQLISNMTINQMRVVCHLILGVLFAAPVGVLVLIARTAFGRPGGESRAPGGPLRSLCPGLQLMAGGRLREGTIVMVMTLLLLEIWVAQQFLGTLMVATLVLMGLGFLAYMASQGDRPAAGSGRRVEGTLALGIFLVGVFGSAGLYGSLKASGHEHGGPMSHHHHEEESGYALDKVALSRQPVTPREITVLGEAQEILASYQEAITKLIRGYYLLDRNYNYSFHNALFLRNTPVLHDFRQAGLKEVLEARQRALQGNRKLNGVFLKLPQDCQVVAFFRDLSGFLAYHFHRAEEMEAMSGELEGSEAGLQHASHLYEGEGIQFGRGLGALLEKHRVLLRNPALTDSFTPFVNTSQEAMSMYRNRMVGF